MADIVDRVTRSRMMGRIRAKNTKPELIVRSFLHGKGLRYRLHDSRLPGRPDVVLPRYRTVVDIRGCFWHSHQACRFATRPQSNAEFWETKLRANVERDRRNTAALEAEGWLVLVVWECEVSQSGMLQELVATILARGK